jgi:ABC-type bacteriocin/lantibiotic exporter with double-glycine peptidase domain
MAQWTVPVYTQRTPNLCWEACARMMWHWRHKNLDTYGKAAGTYLNLDTGLTQWQMDAFYKQLGLRSLTGARGVNLRHALGWTPVIVTNSDQVTGHAMVLAGVNANQYTVVNPCAIEAVDFEKNSAVCSSAGILSLTRAEVEKPLGSYMWYW